MICLHITCILRLQITTTQNIWSKMAQNNEGYLIAPKATKMQEMGMKANDSCDKKALL